MKNLALCLCCLCLLGTSVPPANAQGTPTPYPPALRHIEKHLPVIESDMEQVANGLLPKEVLDKLKRIEKLSKRLHGELSRFQ